MKIGVYALLVLTCIGAYGFRHRVFSEGMHLLQTHPVQADTIIPGSSKLFASDAKLQHISAQFNFTEGPAVDKQGNVFFTDQPNDKIWKICD